MNNFDQRYRHIVTLLEITGLTHAKLAQELNLKAFRFSAINLTERKNYAVSFLENYQYELIQACIQNTKYKIDTILYWMDIFVSKDILRLSNFEKYTQIDYKYIDLIINLNKKFYKINNKQIAYNLYLSYAYLNNAAGHKPTAARFIKDHCKIKLKIFNWFKSFPEHKTAMQTEHDLLLKCL
tara:strand:- start:889 stop:1434 length:546 start_codon:yes stop_codon:yes gene_type:complete